MLQSDFDWGITKRRLVVFIPNFGRKHLLAPTLERFKTTVPNDQWIFLVVNDGKHEDLSDLERHNLVWFTFKRDPAVERNGCMIRNYVLRRIESELISTRDPEIFIDGPFIEKAIEHDDTIWRPCDMTEIAKSATQAIINNPHTDLRKKPKEFHWKAVATRHEAFHAGVTLSVHRLMEMGGYDEQYRYGYGHEDVDLWRRLLATKVPLVIDKEVTTFHVWHPRMRRFMKTSINNHCIYSKKDPRNVVRNKGKNWGEG